MMEVLGALRDVNISRVLYEHDFPDWFVIHAGTHYKFNWDGILITLRNGRFFFPDDSYFSGPTSNITGQYLDKSDAKRLGEHLIRKLAALASTLPSGNAVANSLQLDGYGVNKAKLELLALEGAVSAQEEEDVLTTLVKSVWSSDPGMVLKHITDAHSLFVERKYHPSLNESRNLVQCLIDGISADTHHSGAHTVLLPGGIANRIQYLKNVGFLTQDEEAAFKSAWGALSAGSHPGVPEREEARIGLVLALEFGQLLLLKCVNWKANGYRKFSSP